MQRHGGVVGDHAVGEEAVGVGQDDIERGLRTPVLDGNNLLVRVDCRSEALGPRIPWRPLEALHPLGMLPGRTASHLGEEPRYRCRLDRHRPAVTLVGLVPGCGHRCGYAEAVEEELNLAGKLLRRCAQPHGGGAVDPPVTLEQSRQERALKLVAGRTNTGGHHPVLGCDGVKPVPLRDLLPAAMEPGPGVARDQVAEENGLVLAEAVTARGLDGSEQRRDDRVTRPNLPRGPPHDVAAFVEHTERMVVGDGEHPAGTQSKAPNGLAVVVGERHHRFQLTALVDHPYTEVPDVGHPGRTRHRLPTPGEQFGDRLQSAIGPDPGVGGEALPARLRSVDLHHPTAG